MKNRILLGLFTVFSILLQAQTCNQYSIKLEGIYGNIIPNDQHVKDIIINPVIGTELSLEFQTMGNKPWQQFNAFPIVGIGAVWLNLGNLQKLGNAFALYPYICFPLIRTNFIKLNLKAGAGLSYLTKTYYNTNTDSLGNTLPSLTGTNSAIGSALNVYFSGGGSLEIPISKGFSLMAEYTWNHMSNGSAVAPNAGLNLLNGFIGLKYSPNYNTSRFHINCCIEDIPREFTFEIIASGGFRQLYYKDNKTFPIGSVVLGVYRPMSNFYRMGLGIDAFYDGVYNGNTQFQRTYLTTDELKNKIRLGVSWQHEIMLGRLIAGFDFGLYLYNPLKNLEPYNDAKNGTLNKPLIYSYNITNEDGWFYTRASLKYTLDKHYFISLGLKTHLQKAEFIEWGLGYRF
ncbi:MAG: acyloxyacyl hydrolase [Paludibacter sp.]|nr:acyloxyacyl hydrolase [Paludibacter sp.]